MSGREFLLYGTGRKEPEPRLLTAGPLTAEFIEGNLRIIAYKGIEVLRAVSYLVRDKDWGTYALHLSDLLIGEDDDTFEISFKALCEGAGGSAIELRASITGAGQRLAFDVAALPHADFLTNRCGFCVLHPIAGLAGLPVIVESVSGDIIESKLPGVIDPWQPFKNLRAITHQVADGILAECRMEGGTFEMEDQRNWSDASYKTYVRPLELPWPYVLKAGVEVRQRVTLTISGELKSRPAASASAGSPIGVGLAGANGRMPGMSLVIAPQDIKASLAALPALAQIAPRQLLLHFDPLAGHETAALEGFARLQRESGAAASLELALPCRDDPESELLAIASKVRAAGLTLESLIVSPSVDRQSTPPGSKWPDCPPLETVYAAARKAFPGLRLGGGMLSYFTELNRKRVPPEQLDFITHATNPIVHAADDLSVMQTLEALPFIVRSVREIYGHKPYHIGPSTIAMRQNPYGGATKANTGLERIPMANRDPRHNGLFAAAWTVGYVARCLSAQPEMLTLSALAGDFGLIASEGEPSPQGGVRPLFHVVQALSELAGFEWRECVVSKPARVAAFAAVGPTDRKSIMIANLTPHSLTADLSTSGLKSETRISMLDEESLACAAPGKALPSVPAPEMLSLKAFAVAFVRESEPGDRPLDLCRR
jgi:D-apionolactonase